MKRVTEERDREGERTKKQTDRRGQQQVRARMTAMRHHANVRTNTSESDRVKDKERERKYQRHLNRQFGNCENQNYETRKRKSSTRHYLQNSRTRTYLPAKNRRDMEVFQLDTPWSHPGSSAKTLRWIDNLTLAIARQVPPLHGGFSTFYSMITPKLESSGFFFSLHKL